MSDFASPWLFLASLSLLPIIWLIFSRERKSARRVTVTDVKLIAMAGRNRFKSILRYLNIALRLVGIALLIVAFARPQTVSQGEDVYSEGIDIVIAMDISSSMLARDLKPDRVSAAKEVAADFVSSRPNDRIGMVLFAKQAFTQCPLTIDHSILLELIDGVKVGLADPDNTAIGFALATSLNRMKDSEAVSKVVILLTDGENNFGLPPTTAAEAAVALGVRIYTIGIGSRGTAPYPATDIFGRSTVQMVNVSIDEELLKDIANSTGGKYFRATNNEKLQSIFKEIDQMERTRIEVRAYKRYAELFRPWALTALVILLISLMISLSVTRGIA